MLVEMLPVAPGPAPDGDRRRTGPPPRRRRGAPGRDRGRQGLGAAAPGAAGRPSRSSRRNRRRLEERLKSLLAGLAAGRPEARRADRPAPGRVPRASAASTRAGHRRVFEKNCGICHQLGGKGARIGPQLDGIGSRGLDRLVEDILDPNRNVDQAFRVTILALKNGQVVSGLLLREEGEVLVLADAQGKEVRVPQSSVAERKTSPLLADAGQPRRSDHPRRTSIACSPTCSRSASRPTRRPRRPGRDNSLPGGPCRSGRWHPSGWSSSKPFTRIPAHRSQCLALQEAFHRVELEDSLGDLTVWPPCFSLTT